MEKAPAASAPPAEDDKLIEIQHAEPVEAAWSLRRPRTRRNLFAAVGAAAIAGLIVGVVLGTMGAKAGGGDDKDDGGTLAPTAWEVRRPLDKGGAGKVIYLPKACRVGDRVYDLCCAGEPVHQDIAFQSGGSTLYNGTHCRRTLAPTLDPTPEPSHRPTPRPTLEQTLAPSISPVPKNRGRTNVWYTLMLEAPDQLRQRVAWALATVFIVSDQGVTNEMYTEPWTGFYDIFVRHAVGNLKDVLKEISYHAHMAQYLTFADGAGKTNSKFDGEKYPDENYSMDLTDSTFLNNHAVRTDLDDSETEGAGRGGAIFTTGSTGSPTQGSYVGGCTFESNVADAGGAAVASWLESWFFNASSFVDNVDNSNDEGLMRLQKGHIIVRDCDFTTAQRIVDHTTTSSSLKVYCSPTLTSANVWVCGGCDDTYETTCGPVVDTNASGFDVTWP